MRYKYKLKHSLIIKLLFFCTISIQAEEIPNYCHDEETNLQWNALTTMEGVHPDLVRLSEYRTEICERVDKGELSVAEGTVLFEDERERVMKRVRSGKF